MSRPLDHKAAGVSGPLDHKAAGVSGPLDGVCVVEFCQALAGPYCCQLLVDLGARVIKIEKPGGDDSRGMPPHYLGDTSLYFMGPNRGKESIVLDLKSPAGLDVARRLVARADIVVENNRPGVMDRLGLGFETLKSLKPNIVLCSISGFGQDGPYRDLPAYDSIVQALSGVMSLTGEPGGKPVRSGVPIGDLCAAMDCALGALAALRRAERTGEAQHLDISMLDVQVSMMSYHLIYYLFSGIVPGVQGQRHSGVPEQGEFTCGDGQTILVAPMSEAMWPALCIAVGQPQWSADPELATRAARMAHVERVRRGFEAVYLGAPAEMWIARLRQAGIPVAPINRLDQVVADPQVRSRGMIFDAQFKGQDLRLVGSPIRFAGEPAPGQAPPPVLGANTRAILEGDLGMSRDEADAIVSQGSSRTRTA